MNDSSRTLSGDPRSVPLARFTRHFGGIGTPHFNNVAFLRPGEFSRSRNISLMLVWHGFIFQAFRLMRQSHNHETNSTRSHQAIMVDWAKDPFMRQWDQTYVSTNLKAGAKPYSSNRFLSYNSHLGQECPDIKKISFAIIVSDRNLMTLSAHIRSCRPFLGVD